MNTNTLKLAQHGARGSTDMAVVANMLVKKYGTKKAPVVAVNEISFGVARGELFGIIGPDGAGKTSLFRMLTTLLLPDGGSAQVDGFDIVKDYRQIRHRVGYMPGRFSLYQDLTVEENLEFFATIFNTTVAENYALIKDIYQQIEPFKSRKAGKLSGGMKQKLALSCALIHRPSVLFLDEPTTGVDAVSRKEFWDMLGNLKTQGITIVVSTPYMDEASLCDRVALMQSGEIMSLDTPDGIVRKFKYPLFAIRAGRMFQLLKDAAAYGNVINVYPFGEYHHVLLRNPAEATELRNHLVTKGHIDLEIHEQVPDIEDCFIALMKKERQVAESL
jgi:drug efflux transport system ATP-binding protein